MPELARDDSLTGLVYEFQSSKHPPTDEVTARQTQREAQDDSPAERCNDASLGRFQFLNILPHQQTKSSRQLETAGSGGMGLWIIPIAGFETEIEPAVLRLDLGDPADITHHRPAQRIRQQIQGRAGWLLTGNSDRKSTRLNSSHSSVSRMPSSA